MPVDSQTRRYTHELVDQLDSAQIEAVARLLAVMIDADEEPLSAEEVGVVAASREHFRLHPEYGVTFDELAAECGFTMEQIVDA